MKTYTLEREQIIPLSIEETFAFFSDAFNLERITPAFLNFRILTPAPIKMEAGTLIEYKLSLFGVPFKWRTLIEQWAPNQMFVDRQIRGPYALWHHTHTFIRIDQERTLMRDVVKYRIPFGPLGVLSHRLFVERMLKMIFDYRAKSTADLLGGRQGFVKSVAGRLIGATAAGD
ncbi:MAG: SRPBCC family protein [Acidobacteria bacterium]|nr:SRPBCC family protein [Acidobacteriota bacterium]